MLIIQLLALAGFIDALYLRWKRMMKKPMVCPLKQDCGQLYEMPQAKFLGIHWDIWGMAYYGALVVVGFDAISVPFEALFFKTMAVIGLAVSAHLLYIQYRVKNFCTWCLVSEAIASLIAAAVFAGT